VGGVIWGFGCVGGWGWVVGFVGTKNGWGGGGWCFS